MSGGILKDSDFKNDRTNSFDFKPEYHDILMALLSTDYFGGNKTDKIINERAILHKQIIENIDKFVNDFDKENLKKDPSYLNALIEAKLIPIITNELKCLLNTMYNADPVIKYQYLIECADRLVGIRRWMIEWNERIKIIRSFFAQGEETNIRMAENEEGPFKNDMLDTLMIKVLNARIRNEAYQYVSEDEKLSYATVYIGSQLYDIMSYPENEVQKILDIIDKNVSNDERYVIIKDKLNSVLSKDDLLEKKILDSLDKIVRAEIVASTSNVTPWDYKNLMRFTEETLRIDKEKIMEICIEKVDSNLEKEVIEALKVIKNRTKR